MATPRLTPRERALRRADRAYWRWMLDDGPPEAFAAAVDDALSQPPCLDFCEADCLWCMHAPPIRHAERARK